MVLRLPFLTPGLWADVVRRLVLVLRVGEACFLVVPAVAFLAAAVLVFLDLPAMMVLWLLEILESDNEKHAFDAFKVLSIFTKKIQRITYF